MTEHQSRAERLLDVEFKVAIPHWMHERILEEAPWFTLYNCVACEAEQRRIAEMMERRLAKTASLSCTFRAVLY